MSVSSSQLETEVKINNNEEILGVERKVGNFHKNIDFKSRRTHK